MHAYMYTHIWECTYTCVFTCGMYRYIHMHVCMCVHMYGCACTYVWYASLWICIFASRKTHAHICVAYVFTCRGINAFVYAYIYVCVLQVRCVFMYVACKHVCICSNVGMHAYVYRCMCVFMFICVRCTYVIYMRSYVGVCTCTCVYVCMHVEARCWHLASSSITFYFIDWPRVSHWRQFSSSRDSLYLCLSFAEITGRRLCLAFQFSGNAVLKGVLRGDLAKLDLFPHVPKDITSGMISQVPVFIIYVTIYYKCICQRCLSKVLSRASLKKFFTHKPESLGTFTSHFTSGFETDVSMTLSPTPAQKEP